MDSERRFITDSREVAEMVEKKHAHLMRDIQGYMKVLELNPNLHSASFFILSSYKDASNQERPCYLLTKQGCEIVANKITGKQGIGFIATYVAKFEEALKNVRYHTLNAVREVVNSIDERKRLEKQN